jgi:hypothetical protein
MSTKTAFRRRDSRPIKGLGAIYRLEPGARRYSTVTLLARLRGLSTSLPFITAVW